MAQIKEEKVNIKTGDKVIWTGKSLQGEVVSVREDADNGAQKIYVVALENGETRHLTAKDIKKQATAKTGEKQ